MGMTQLAALLPQRPVAGSAAAAGPAPGASPGHALGSMTCFDAVLAISAIEAALLTDVLKCACKAAPQNPLAVGSHGWLDT